FVQYDTSRLAAGSLSGSRQAASWCPQLIRNALKCSSRSAGTPGHLQLPLDPGPPDPAAAQLRQYALTEPVRLLQVRVAGQDELRDAQRRVLLDQVGHLLVAADQRGAGPAPPQADPGPQVRVYLQVTGHAAVPVRRVQRMHPVLAGRL